jgi:hypothetical protein
MKNRKQDSATGCPKDDVLVKAFLRELSLDETERIVDHMVVCGSCRAKFDLLRGISSELAKKKERVSDGKLSAAEEKELRKLARMKLEEIEKSSPPFFRWTPARLAVAATALVVVVMAVFWITRVDRGTVYREIKGHDELTLLGPSGKLPSPPLVFEWTPYESAEDYTFEIIDEELNTIFLKTNVLEPRLTLPQDIVKKMKKGITYLWKVYALDDDANVLASGTAYIEIE